VRAHLPDLCAGTLIGVSLMSKKTQNSDERVPVARSDEALLDDPGNEDPGSLLDAPVPLRPSTRVQRGGKPGPGEVKPR
jgi:hypothetical protein